MKIKLLSTFILAGISMQAVADKAYWKGTSGDYVRDRNGHCVRTINWTPEAALPGCEGVETKAAAAQPATDSAAENTTATAVAPAVAMAAATGDETESTTINLSSGAAFEHGGSTLSDEGKKTIAELVSQYEGQTVDAVIIEGHTDATGDAAYNQQLSEQRAEAVKAEIVANGGNADKITTVGYGETKPIADNDTREGRAKNRRVEIRVEGARPKQ